MYLPNVFGEENSQNKVFHVPIGNTKNTDMHDFYPRAPEVKYVQDDKNTCCLVSLDSALFAAN